MLNLNNTLFIGYYYHFCDHYLCLVTTSGGRLENKNRGTMAIYRLITKLTRHFECKLYP